MKRLSVILVLVAMMFSYSAKSQTKVNWMSVTEALAQGEKDGKKAKLIFMDCYTDWCKWCKVLDEKSFSNDTIARILNYYFYPVKFDAEGQENLTINGEEYKSTLNKKGGKGTHELMRVLWEGQRGGGYPSMVIRKANFAPVTVIMGYLPANDLEPQLVYFAEGFNKEMSIEKFQSEYAEKHRDGVMKKIFKD
ncbi:MAG: DUF255 domain-containing protein [Bacteroidales bacterium]|nr:DUF255 domain-containing protein [Candidatus Scybalousia scybalohippi]